MAGYIPDTDHISALDRGSDGGRRLASRLASVASDTVATTIVTYEEQMRGWLAYVATLRGIDQQVGGYAKLLRMLRLYCSTPVEPFEAAAAEHFQRLWLMRLRIGTMDLKIAAIALARDAVLLTCNRKDFGLIPGLTCDDWVND